MANTTFSINISTCEIRFFVAEFVSRFSRLLDVELPIFGVVTVHFTMYAVYRKIARTPASFSIVLLETIFATRLSSS